VLFWVGAVLVGLVAPILLDVGWRRQSPQRRQRVRAALILVGGLTLRFVIVMAPQWPKVKPWHL
jgi:formate-dependent nitrite reductase membrane component NrfD